LVGSVTHQRLDATSVLSATADKSSESDVPVARLGVTKTFYVGFAFVTSFSVSTLIPINEVRCALHNAIVQYFLVCGASSSQVAAALTDDRLRDINPTIAHTSAAAESRRVFTSVVIPLGKLTKPPAQARG
jgi:hypothetical protein